MDDELRPLEEAVGHLRRWYAEAGPEGMRVLAERGEPADPAVVARLAAATARRRSDGDDGTGAVPVAPAEGNGDAGDVAGVLARRLAAFSRAAAAATDTVAPLVEALAAALQLGVTEGPFADAESELVQRLPGAGEESELQAAMLAGAGAARALRCLSRQQDELWPGVRNLLSRAEQQLPPPAPTAVWLGAGLSLLGIDLVLAMRRTDLDLAQAAARLAGVLGELLDRHPSLAASMSRDAGATMAALRLPAGGFGVRESLRLMEQVLPMLSAFSSFRRPGTRWISVPCSAGWRRRVRASVRRRSSSRRSGPLPHRCPRWTGPRAGPTG